jgi:hypothetical protein
MTEPLRPDPPPSERQAVGSVYEALAGRLGIDPAARRDGPLRDPFAGPSDEPPLDAMLRLSAQMERLAAEIARNPSRTYRAQLWHQWRALGRS